MDYFAMVRLYCFYGFLFICSLSWFVFYALFEGVLEYLSYEFKPGQMICVKSLVFFIRYILLIMFCAFSLIWIC